MIQELQMTDWLSLSLIHHSGLFIIVLLLNPSAGRRREFHLGQPWPPQQLYASYPKQDSHDFFSFNSTLPSSWRWKRLNVISLVKFELLDNLMPKVLYFWEVGGSLKFNLKSWRDLSELLWNVWKFGFFFKNLFTLAICLEKTREMEKKIIMQRRYNIPYVSEALTFSGSVSHLSHNEQLHGLTQTHFWRWQKWNTYAATLQANICKMIQ